MIDDMLCCVKHMNKVVKIVRNKKMANGIPKNSSWSCHPKNRSAANVESSDQAWRPYNDSITNTLNDLDEIAIPAPPSMTKAGARQKKSKTVTDLDVTKARELFEEVKSVIELAQQDTTMKNVNTAWIEFRRVLSEIYRLKSLGGMKGEESKEDSKVDV